MRQPMTNQMPQNYSRPIYNSNGYEHYQNIPIPQLNEGIQIPNSIPNSYYQHHSHGNLIESPMPSVYINSNSNLNLIQNQSIQSINSQRNLIAPPQIPIYKPQHQLNEYQFPSEKRDLPYAGSLKSKGTFNEESFRALPNLLSTPTKESSIDSHHLLQSSGNSHLFYDLLKSFREDEHKKLKSQSRIVLENMKSTHEFVYLSLYEGLPINCSSCGKKFKASEEYSEHMDRHFQTSKARYLTKSRDQMKDRPSFLSSKVIRIALI